MQVSQVDLFQDRISTLSPLHHWSSILSDQASTAPACLIAQCATQHRVQERAIEENRLVGAPHCPNDCTVKLSQTSLILPLLTPLYTRYYCWEHSCRGIHRGSSQKELHLNLCITTSSRLPLHAKERTPGIDYQGLNQTL